MVVHRNWEDLKIPIPLVNYLNSKMCDFDFVKFLTKFLVLNTPVKQGLIYICDNCGHAFRPDKISDSITFCFGCEGQSKIRLKKEFRIEKARSPEYSLLSVDYVKKIINAMVNNYFEYYGKEPEDLKFGIQDENNFYSQFCGGELVIDKNPRLAILKSSILTPYIWDSNFEFSNGKRHLNFILSQFST